MQNYQKAIWVKTSFTGIHCWPKAPPQVRYLRHPHRHVFNVRVKCAVEHSDREVEFHMLLADVQCAIGSIKLNLISTRSMSCEMMAEGICENLLTKEYPILAVQVDEDGECGAEVYPLPPRIDEKEAK